MGVAKKRKKRLKRLGLTKKIGGYARDPRTSRKTGPPVVGRGDRQTYEMDPEYGFTRGTKKK